MHPLTAVFAHGSLGLLPDHESVMFLMPALPALLVATIVLGATLEKRGALGETGRTVALQTPLVLIAALLSLAAAGIHFAVIAEHAEIDLSEGVFFFALGWFQLIWAQVYLVRASRPVAWAAVIVSAGTVLIWAVSRTVGLPIGATPGVPEALGLADLLASSFELGLIGLLLPGLLGARFEHALKSEIPVQKAFVLAGFMVVAVGLLTALALVPKAFAFLAF